MNALQPRGGAVAGDWWDPAGEGLTVWGAYQAKGAASYAASLVNLSNPGTYNLTETNGAVSWSSAGWAFVAASAQALDTGITKPIDIHTYALLVEFSGNVINTGTVLAGVDSDGGSNATGYSITANDYNKVRYYAGSSVTVVPKLDSGNLGLSDQYGYRNGSLDSAQAGDINTANRSMYIGARQATGGGGEMYCTATIEAVVFYSQILSAGQMAAVAAAMAAH